MASFFSRVAGEAAAALSDAYGHVVHGDDAGSSARVVWVVHPTKVPIDLGGSEGSKHLNTQKFGELGRHTFFLLCYDTAFVRIVLH